MNLREAYKRREENVLQTDFPDQINPVDWKPGMSYIAEEEFQFNRQKNTIVLALTPDNSFGNVGTNDAGWLV